MPTGVVAGWLRQDGVAAPVIGPRTPDQLPGFLRAVDVELSTDAQPGSTPSSRAALRRRRTRDDGTSGGAGRLLMRVLAVIEHPDDEVLGCGATLARLVDQGHQARVLLTLRRSDPRGLTNWPRILEDFQSACEVLGVEPVVNTPLLEERSADFELRELIDAVRPHVEWAQTVLTHWSGDVHQVHRGIARAVEIATRPFRVRRNVYLFEVGTSTDQTFVQHFSPQMFVAVSAGQVQRALAAMACYSTENAPGRAVRDIERALEYRGAQIGVSHAEAFVVARQFL